MRIGITGATGFIGSELIRAATGSGHSVVGFSRRKEPDLPGCEEARIIQQDGTADLSGLDAVVHLSGESILGLWTSGKRRAIRESRIQSTRSIVDQLEQMETRPKVFVCASAVGIYGDRGDDLLDESELGGSGFLAEVTRDWEAAAARAEALGIRVVCPRIGMVLGKGGGVARTLKRVFGLGLGGKLGNGRQWMSWIHVIDVARLILFCLENDSLRGPVNAVSPNPARNEEFTREVARVLRRPAFAPAPTFALRLLLREFSGVFLDSIRVNSANAANHGFTFEFTELRPALESTWDQA